jgi:cytochrome b561
MGGAAAALGLERARYSSVAIWFHWIIAALIIVNLFLGLFHEDFAKATRGTMMFFHKSIGMTVLALTLLRLLWRLTHRPPAYDPVMKKWEMSLARVTHWLFYGLLLAVPMTGWLLSSSGGRATSVFGLFTIGALPVSQSEGSRDLFDTLHELLAYGIIALVLLHVGGALKHHLEGHRHMFGRMAPWAYRER